MAGAMSDQVIQDGDKWLLPMQGNVVSQCRMDYAFTIVVGELDHESFLIEIREPFTFVRADGQPTTIEPEADPLGMGAALSVLRGKVVEAVVYEDGRLEIHFERGERIRVSAGTQYEPWTVTGPDGLRFVSLPGGGLAIWRGRHGDPDLQL